MCERLGVSHSHFLGGPPVWTELDRQKALQFLYLQRATCSNCGTREDEWDESQGGHRHAYHVEPLRCRGCEVLESAQDRYAHDHRMQGQRGVKIALLPSER